MLQQKSSSAIRAELLLRNSRTYLKGLFTYRVRPRYAT